MRYQWRIRGTATPNPKGRLTGLGGSRQVANCVFLGNVPSNKTVPGTIVVKRAENSGVRLTKAQAAIVKGMLIRGDRQHDIASWFGVNGGRIGEISKGHKFFEVLPQTDGLPRPGPYMSGEASDKIVGECRRIRSKVRRLLSDCSLGPDAVFIANSMMKQLDGIIDD